MHSARPGRDVRVLTHLHVREDALQLFGFATEAERRLFLLLISVSGIGPKLAQGILSGIAVGDFEQAVRGNDLASLTRVPGIGKKTAERLVLELKEKIGEAESAGRTGRAVRTGRRWRRKPFSLWCRSVIEARPGAGSGQENIETGRVAVA